MTKFKSVIVSMGYLVVSILPPFFCCVIAAHVGGKWGQSSIEYWSMTSIIAILLGFLMIKKAGYSLHDCFVRKPETSMGKTFLLFVPLLVAEIPMLVFGIEELAVSDTILSIIYAITGGFLRELFFRGLILKELSAFGERFAVATSGILSGVEYFIGAIIVGTVDLAIIPQSILFGFVLAELAVITKSIWPAAAMRSAHMFIKLIIVRISYEQLGVMLGITLIYAIFLWFKIGKKPSGVQMI